MGGRSPGNIYQPAETLTYFVMTGHRAGHPSSHVLNEMTGSVAGHDGEDAEESVFAGWHQSSFRSG